MGIANAIKNYGVKREELFITGKVWKYFCYKYMNSFGVTNTHPKMCARPVKNRLQSLDLNILTFIWFIIQYHFILNVALTSILGIKIILYMNI